MAVLKDTALNSGNQWPHVVWQSLYSSDTNRMEIFKNLIIILQITSSRPNNRYFFIKYQPSM